MWAKRWHVMKTTCNIRGNMFITASPCGLESDGGLLPEPLPLTPDLFQLWGPLPARFRHACTLGDSLRFLAGLLPRAAGRTQEERGRPVKHHIITTSLVKPQEPPRCSFKTGCDDLPELCSLNIIEKETGDGELSERHFRKQRVNKIKYRKHRKWKF